MKRETKKDTKEKMKAMDSWLNTTVQIAIIQRRIQGKSESDAGLKINPNL